MCGGAAGALPQEIASVMVEGGASVLGSLLGAELAGRASTPTVDMLVVTIAPSMASAQPSGAEGRDFSEELLAAACAPQATCAPYRCT